VPDRDCVSIYRTRLPMADFVRCKVGHDLVPVEIEVHPVGGAAAFRTAEQIAIKLTGGRDVMDRKSEMKRGNGSSGVAHDRARISVEWVVIDGTTKSVGAAVMVREK